MNEHTIEDPMYDLNPDYHFVQMTGTLSLTGADGMWCREKYFHEEEVKASVVRDDWDTVVLPCPYYSSMMGVDIIRVGLAKKFGVDLKSLLGMNKAMKRFLEAKGRCFEFKTGRFLLKDDAGVSVVDEPSVQTVYVLRLHAPFDLLGKEYMARIFEYMIGIRPGLWFCSTREEDVLENLEDKEKEGSLLSDFCENQYLIGAKEDTYVAFLREFVELVGFERIDGTEMWWRRS